MTCTKITLLLLGVLAFAPLGCQEKPPFVPVEGTVTKEGKPLAGVIVDFYPDDGTPGPRSTSEPTDEAGHYRLRSTRNGDDGAAVGTHRVCIHDTRRGFRMVLSRLPKEVESSEEVRKKVKEFNKKTAPASLRVPPRYGRANETPLRVEVHPAPQVIDLKVK
jgi:hypothetical protein